MTYQIPAANDVVPSEYLRALDDIDRLAEGLDFQFRLPLTKVRFGWDRIRGAGQRTAHGNDACRALKQIKPDFNILRRGQR
jgi:hypothetical protein